MLNDIIVLVLKYLTREADTLMSAALVSHDLYDIAIPWLYMTVVVTEENGGSVEYGHTLESHFLHGHGKSNVACTVGS